MRLPVIAARLHAEWLALRAAAPMIAVLASLLLWAAPAAAQTQAWPDSPKLSGNAFLPPGLRKLQDESATSPIALWLDKGRALWMWTCQHLAYQ